MTYITAIVFLLIKKVLAKSNYLLIQIGITKFLKSQLFKIPIANQFFFIQMRNPFDENGLGDLDVHHNTIEKFLMEFKFESANSRKMELCETNNLWMEIESCIQFGMIRA